MELPGGRRSLFSRIEAFIARHADAVILNTDSAAQLWVNRYPAYRAKFHVIWNGFDPGQTLSAAQTPLRSVRTIAHVGELYAGRDPGPILDALVDLVESNRLEQDDFQLTLAGPVNDERVSKSSSLARLKELNVLDYRPNQIAQDEARRINMESDGLLLLQPQSSVQVPAKLFDYIRIGRPVLAYVQPDSPSELILKKSGIPSRFIYPGENLESIKEKILGFLQLSNRSSRSSQWFDETFSSHSQVIELAEVVRSVKGAL
jgi:hypothetical protein